MCSNPHLGKGGAQQYYFVDHDKLERDGHLERIGVENTVNRNHSLPQYEKLEKGTMNSDKQERCENKVEYGKHISIWDSKQEKPTVQSKGIDKKK